LNYSLDVGGGSVPRGTAHTLARIPLRWMIRECFKLDTGITFYSERLRKIGLDPNTLYPHVLPRPPGLSGSSMKIRQRVAEDCPEEKVLCETEEEAELHDALSPHHDQLDIAPFWWILEYLSLQRKYRDVSQNGDAIFLMSDSLSYRVTVPGNLSASTSFFFLPCLNHSLFYLSS
jgi:hypothetical protein